MPSRLWKSGSSALVIRWKLNLYQDGIGGSVRGISDVDEWTIRSPRIPLPCHRCEYGGYRGTWSSVNESLLTYLWRNSVKDFPRPKQSHGSQGRERTLWRWVDWCCMTSCSWHTCNGGGVVVVGSFICDTNSHRHCNWEVRRTKLGTEANSFHGEPWASDLTGVSWMF